jgi:hypothetical protein
MDWYLSRQEQVKEMSILTGVFIGIQLFICPFVIGFLLFIMIITNLREGDE